MTNATPQQQVWVFLHEEAELGTEVVGVYGNLDRALADLNMTAMGSTPFGELAPCEAADMDQEVAHGFSRVDAEGVVIASWWLVQRALVG